MSFRSRSRTSQPVVRHRSLSSSRVPTSSTSSNPYLTSSSSAYTPNRPLTVSYSVTPNTYNSRENLYSPTKRSNFFSNGCNNTTSSTSSSSSPYAHRKESYNTNSSPYKSPYADRYVSPYSSYDNGVTTAGLNLSAYTSGNSYKTNSPFNKPQSSVVNNYNNTNPTKSYKRDYTTPPRNITSLLSAKRFSSSNNSLNTYIPSTASITSSIGRSQSFKSDDRRSRRSSGKTNLSKTDRSNSISSEKSEGYEVRFFFLFCFGLELL